MGRPGRARAQAAGRLPRVTAPRRNGTPADEPARHETCRRGDARPILYTGRCGRLDQRLATGYPGRGQYAAAATVAVEPFHNVRPGTRPARYGMGAEEEEALSVDHSSLEQRSGEADDVRPVAGVRANCHVGAWIVILTLLVAAAEDSAPVIICQLGSARRVSHVHGTAENNHVVTEDVNRTGRIQRSRAQQSAANH